MTQLHDRLTALHDAEFADFVERLGVVWSEWEQSVSPPSPDGTVELSLACEADVRLPGETDDLDAFLGERLMGYPPGLASRGREVVKAVDSQADFDRDTSIGHASAVLDFSHGKRRVARIRFGPTSLLVFADRGGELETVVTLTAHRQRHPPVTELGVVDAVEGALGRCE